MAANASPNSAAALSRLLEALNDPGLGVPETQELLQQVSGIVDTCCEGNAQRGEGENNQWGEGNQNRFAPPSGVPLSLNLPHLAGRNAAVAHRNYIEPGYGRNLSEIEGLREGNGAEPYNYNNLQNSRRGGRAGRLNLEGQICRGLNGRSVLCNRARSRLNRGRSTLRGGRMKKKNGRKTRNRRR